MDAPIAQPESPYESSRRIENLARLGTVTEVRLAAPARARVRLGDNTTTWIPWITHRAGGAAGGRKWHPPVVGEQCLVISPGGDLGRAVALLGVYSDAMNQGSAEAGCERTDWDADNGWQWLAGALDVSLTERHRVTVNDAVTLELRPDAARISTPQASIDLGPGGQVVIRAGAATLTIGPGQITSNVDVVAAGISLDRHVHGGVESGGDTTSGPI